MQFTNLMIIISEGRALLHMLYLILLQLMGFCDSVPPL